MRRTRIVRLGARELEKMFDVPEGGRVIAVGTSFDPYSIEVVVDHPDYDEVPDEAQSPVVMGEITVVTAPGEWTKAYRRWELKP